MKIAVIIIALLVCSMVTYRLGFFKFAGTVLGSVFKKPSTLMYPVVPREWQERTRGSVSIVGEKCIGCGICARACPTNAIAVDKKGGSWTIERMQCVQCSACVDGCPTKCLTMENLYTIPDVVKVVDTFEIPVKPPKKAAPAKPAAKPAAKDETAKPAEKTEEAKPAAKDEAAKATEKVEAEAPAEKAEEAAPTEEASEKEA